MMVRADFQPSNRDRVKSGLAVAAIHALLGYALIAGLEVRTRAALIDSLTLVDLAADPLPPPVPENIPAPDKTPEPEGAASPPNLRANPTETVVPPPAIRLPVAQPIPAAPIASSGSASSAGATDIRGPGTGSGGQGIGLGSGNSGTGTGGGGGGGSRARWLRGSIGDEDYPRREFEAGIGGTVHLRFVVGVDGRVADCRVTRSSGSRGLDETTCRLIQKRFRYRPARNAQGRPIPSVIPGEQDWRVTRRPDLVIEEPPEELPRQ